MFGIAVIGKACSLFFFFCSWWFYVPPSDVKMLPTEQKTEYNVKRGEISNGINGGTVNIHFENQ